MKNFDGLGLNSVLQQSLKHMKYTIPTPIQAQAIPVALDGRDVLGSAQTGTGKTAAFAIPLVEALLNDERAGALVMTPTRELGKQVMEIMRQLIGPKSKINTAFLIGGDPYSKQNMQLKRRPRLIVGTPGRINDHRERGNLDLENTRFLVLDEMDRMLDMGFSIQIDRIIKYLPNERQTLMFSATMPKNILSMADKYLHNPERIAIGSTINVAENIDQKIIRVDQDKKYDVLANELQERSGTILIFVKTKHGADKLAKRLRFEDHKVDAIHGDLKQNKRERVIQAYRNKSFRILVATDVVARGLDVPHIAHVINYDMPQVPEDYIHRIGRTARAGASGEALCLVSPQDGRKWSAIEQMLFPEKYAGKPANDHRSGKKSSGNKKFSGRGKPYGAGRGRDEQGASSEQRSGGYQGKRKFSGDRASEGNRSAQGEPSFKPKRSYSSDRTSEGKQGDQAQGEKRSFKSKRNFSSDNRSEGNRSAQGENSFKPKRSYSSDRTNEGKQGAQGENSFAPKRSFSSDKPMHKNVTKRSRDFAEDRNSWSQTSRGGSADGNKAQGKHNGNASPNASGDNRSIGNGGPRKFVGKPTYKQDGDQPRRFKRSDSSKAGSFAGSRGGSLPAKKAGFKGDKKAGFKGNHAA
jgi:superfamily II DNA/RNA helicase